MAEALSHLPGAVSRSARRLNALGSEAPAEGRGLQGHADPVQRTRGSVRVSIPYTAVLTTV